VLSLVLVQSHLGIDGILTFFEGHRCGRYCRQEWAMPRRRSSGRIPIQQGTLMEDDQDHAPTLEDRLPLSNQHGQQRHKQHQQYGYDDDSD